MEDTNLLIDVEELEKKVAPSAYWDTVEDL